MVSDNGKYVVTLDDWYSMGYGADVVVYYNEKGHFIKRHMLEDISPFPINTYVSTISSIRRRCGQKFIDSERVLICFRDRKGKIEERIYDLKKGRVVASQ